MAKVATNGAQMKTLPIVLSMSALAFASSALAAGDLSRADPIEIVIEMGTSDAADKPMYFKPNHLDLETGKAYKIVLRNVDEIVHEFAAPELALHSFTRKVEIKDEAGEMIAEIFGGNITEVEIGAGHEVEWFIVPVQTGENLPMECLIEGHMEAGMFGTVTIR